MLSQLGLELTGSAASCQGPFCFNRCPHVPGGSLSQGGGAVGIASEADRRVTAVFSFLPEACARRGHQVAVSPKCTGEATWSWIVLSSCGHVTPPTLHRFLLLTLFHFFSLLHPDVLRSRPSFVSTREREGGWATRKPGVNKPSSPVVTNPPATLAASSAQEARWSHRPLSPGCNGPGD